MRITIIDYGLGNLRSVYNALKFLGASPLISESPHDAQQADKIILPGVGSSKDAMSGLKKRGLMEVLKKFLASGKPYLGICLGLQILFEKSEEGDTDGLGIFKGPVKRFREEDGIKVPHIGWNTVKAQSSNAKITGGIKDESYFYFDHSYYVLPQDKSIIAGTTEYGLDFTSMIEKDKIYGVQFHPERSQDLGLKILKNFIKL